MDGTIAFRFQTYTGRPASIDLRGHLGAFLDWSPCSATFCPSPPTSACTSSLRSTAPPTPWTSAITRRWSPWKVCHLRFGPNIFILNHIKVHISREGHKILRNLQQLFGLCTGNQIIGGVSQNFAAFSEYMNFTLQTRFSAIRLVFVWKKQLQNTGGSCFMRIS